ncbi:MAG: RNA polymerase sigma factor [Phycisphaerae bacterium]
MSDSLETRDLNVKREPSSEPQTVLRAQRGDNEAFAELVRLYQRRAVSVAYRLVGNIEDASDVSQEAFIRAHRCLDQLDDASRFGAWLLRIVTNLALNQRRTRKATVTGSVDAGTAESGNVAREGAGTGAAPFHREGAPAASEELRAAIGTAIEQLPERQRVALILFTVEGLPQKQVAEILECSVELVKWNVFQARRRLKELLKDHL